MQYMNDQDQALRFWTEKVGFIVVSEKGITVGEWVNMPAGRVFNFADDENNYFAVMEKK